MKLPKQLVWNKEAKRWQVYAPPLPPPKPRRQTPPPPVAPEVVEQIKEPVDWIKYGF